MRLLIVEDDTPLRELLHRGLSEEGHVVDVLPDGRECDAYLAGSPYDAIILDVNLPYEDGLAIVRRLRARDCRVPVLLLTARDGVSDVIDGLDAGADDYLRKPFAFGELEARLRSLARRPPSWTNSVLRVGDLVFDATSREAKRGERELGLTSKEGAFLEVLMRHAGQTVTRRVLEDRLWDHESDRESNVLDVYARRLRVKLTSNGEVQMLNTVRGLGYRLDAPE